jgi:hypothetical protein
VFFGQIVDDIRLEFNDPCEGGFQFAVVYISCCCSVCDDDGVPLIAFCSCKERNNRNDSLSHIFD